MNYNQAELCKDCKRPVEKLRPSGSEDTAIGLLRMFRRYNLCDDRRGYDAEDLMQAYPELPLREAKKLQRMMRRGC
tara:strand:- start:45 stop:272 length:228 start_codon:yes stop_codon:yes gene_type:complete